LQLESITFFISTDSTLLHPYLESKAKLLPRIADLRVLTKDNASQQVRIDSLLYNVKQLMAFTDKGLLKNGTDYATEVLSRRVKNGFMYRQNIRKIIQNIKAEEQRLLIEREQAHQRSIAAFNKTFLLLIS